MMSTEQVTRLLWWSARRFKYLLEHVTDERVEVTVMMVVKFQLFTRKIHIEW